MTPLLRRQLGRSGRVIPPHLGPRPSTQEDERMDMRNNVFYNWAGHGCYGGEGMNVNIVNNYYKPGPATMNRGKKILQRIAAIGIRTTRYTNHGTQKANVWDKMWHKWGTFYVAGNVNPEDDDVTRDNWTYGIYGQIDNDDVDGTLTPEVKRRMRRDAPVPFEAVTTHTAEEAYLRVLACAGASLRRDAVDEMIVNDTRRGTASCTGTSEGTSSLPGLIDSQDDLRQAFPDAGDDWSPWPELKSATVPKDTDRDGMPDAWEDANELDKNNAADGAAVGTDGYTNLERYMNSLVADIMEAGNEGGILLSGNEEYEEPGGDTPVQTVYYDLSGKTYRDGDTQAWNFDNGFTITNANGKSYSKGESDCMKFSRNVQFTINLPEGVKVTKVGIVGYDNYDDVDGYLAELNGLQYGETEYVFPKKVNDAPVYASHEIELDTPAEGAITFTVSGQQCALKFTLTTEVATGIADVTVGSKPNGRTFTLQGVEVKEPLQPGIYIRDGKKFVVR